MSEFRGVVQSGADPESGTLTFGVNVATFDNIETVMLGAGDDSVIGSDGNDTISTGGGADTIKMGAGDDVVDLGAGGSDYDADVIVLEDGFGNDTIAGFDAPTSNGNSTFTGIDTLDVSGLYDLPVGDPDRMPVMTNDIVVSDDGSGNAVLTFPNGETITLNGISPADADDTDFLHAIGIPLPDGTVEGTAGDDIIDQSYIGDPDGDMVDGNDAILPGDTGDDDLIYGYGGTDSITAGNGDDRIFGGDGNDNIDGGLGNDYLYGGLGNDTIEGGDGGDALYAGSGNDTLDGGDGNDTLVGGSGIDTMSGGEGGLDYDTIDMSADTVPVTVTFSDDETGTITAGTNTISFSEIEHIILTSQDDVVDGTAAT